ncbi:unnamed protein product [Symbiodinium sp. CCMP2592]|nr:unnamed protein product [Symbiodinium sp. CCMP2592]
MASDNLENPNTQDVPEFPQVMIRPNPAAPQGGDQRQRPLIMNGVTAPMRGSHDMDGEVVAERPQGLPAPASSNDFADATGGQPALAQGSDARPEQIQAPLDSPLPMGRVPGSGETGIRRGAAAPALGIPGPSLSGVLTGVLRAVQTLPATVENLMVRTATVRQVPGTPGQHDSVEYASVAGSAHSSVERTPPAPPPRAPEPLLFDVPTLVRMQQMQESAPLLYQDTSLGPTGSHLPLEPGVGGNSAGLEAPRPPSTSSSELQAEVRRQLSELMATRDEESRRLRAQVEALSMEIHHLRMRAELEAHPGMQTSRPQAGFPGFGWLGRGLGSLIGQSRSDRTLDLGTAPGFPTAPIRPATSTPRPPPQPSPRAILNQEMMMTAAQGQGQPQPTLGFPTFGLGQIDPTLQLPQELPVPVSRPTVLEPPPPSLGTPNVGVGPDVIPVPGPSAHSEPAVTQGYPGVPTAGVAPPPQASAAGSQPPGTSSGTSGLDPMTVVLSGMAQLQSVVKEMASPKGDSKPEVIKPGVVSLPELPPHGPESCLSFADWLHASKPALADISDSSEVLWAKTVEEAQAWYGRYLKMDPLTRLTAKPSPSEELAQPKWSRVARRIETMIIAASPQAIKDELSASRTSGLLPLVCRLFIIYGPGSLTEREIGLKHITEPPAGTSIQDTIDILRRWQRWGCRMSELGGVLPDSSLQVRALTKITRSVLQQNPEVAFRVNLARASLQIDLTPDPEKVQKLHAQLLGELEAIAHRGDKDKGAKDQVPTPAKVKGVEATPATVPPPPKKPPQSPPKGPPTAKTPGHQDSSSGKPVCSFYSGHNGCEKGADCTYEHDWNSFSASEKAARCKVCGGKTHKSADCRAGPRSEDAKAKSKAKGPPQRPGSTATPIPPPPPAATEANQQIKSMLADAARMLQEAMPPAAAIPVETLSSGNQANPVQAHVASPPPKAHPSATVQGTPVTLASLSAQLDILRAMTRDPEVKTCSVPLHDDQSANQVKSDLGQAPVAGVSLEALGREIRSLAQRVKGFEVRALGEGKESDSGVALLDSGATHAVIPFHERLRNLEKVPVTLAGDEKQEWLRTQGGTLVVPPDPLAPAGRPVQTILPLGALVESLNCQVHWSKRKGLRVVHPTLGVLTTRISDNTCPYVAEDQALRLISELEDQRLEGFKQRVQNLECHLEAYDKPIEPTESMLRFARTGDRLDALRAFLVQPHLGFPEDLKVSLAEQVPIDTPGSDKALLKLLPLKRSARRSLLDSSQWVVHLCSGKDRALDPLPVWARERGMPFLRVDPQQVGGKGWDLAKRDGVWKVLMWAAAQGRIATVLVSPPAADTDNVRRIVAQGMILWSLASVVRGCGIPYVAEHHGLLQSNRQGFNAWSKMHTVCLNQGSLGDKYLRPTDLVTNLDLHYLSTLSPKGIHATPPQGRAARGSTRELLSATQSAGLDNPTAYELETEALLRAFEAESIVDSDSEGEPDEVVAPDTLRNDTSGEGMEPECVRGDASLQASLRPKPKGGANICSTATSLIEEIAGRDEGCITGKTLLRYGLVGAFRVPRSLIQDPDKPHKPDGVKDLFSGGSSELPDGENELAEYEPSDPGGELFPELFGPVMEASQQSQEESNPLPKVSAASAEDAKASVWDPVDLPKDKEGMERLIEELSEPVDQVVLRYFIPLRTKSGVEVAEALQQMILQINQRFPVRSIHHDPGTEFGSTAAGWLATGQDTQPRIDLSQRVAHEFLVSQDLSMSGIREVLRAIAQEAEVHRDWRNEWGTFNYAMHVPGEVQLWVAAQTQEAQVKSLGVSSSEDSSESSIDSDELRRQIEAASNEEPTMQAQSAPLLQPVLLSEDLQPDMSTALIGWDFSGGNPGDAPHAALEDVELTDYLRARDAGDAFARLRTLGTEVPNDLQFLFIEDLVEFGFPEKVDEGAFTPNIEDLLANLQGPLEVTHNVSPTEVRQNLAKWRPAAKAELDTFESMSVIRKFYGGEARAILRDPNYEVIPGKPVCTVKPGEPFKRKFRIVSCGNYAKTTAESPFYAGGAGAECLRALLVHSARRGRRAYGLDVKSAFLLASIPDGVTKRYAMRPPRILIDLQLAREDEVWIIDRALYGFRESPRWWSLFRDSFLAKASWDTELGRITLEQLSSESMSQGSALATATDPLRFLGVDIFAELDEENQVIGYSLGQESYIAELLRSHEVKENPRATAPISKEWVREVPPDEDFTEAELRGSQRITGELLWLADGLRIYTDASFAPHGSHSISAIILQYDKYCVV